MSSKHAPKSYHESYKQRVALEPFIKEVESVVKELVPDAPDSLIRRRTDVLRSWLMYELDKTIEPQPISVYDGVVLVAGPVYEKKRVARGFRNAWLDILVDKAPLMDNLASLDAIAEERGL